MYSVVLHSAEVLSVEEEGGGGALPQTISKSYVYVSSVSQNHFLENHLQIPFVQQVHSLCCFPLLVSFPSHPTFGLVYCVYCGAVCIKEHSQQRSLGGCAIVGFRVCLSNEWVACNSITVYSRLHTDEANTTA